MAASVSVGSAFEADLEKYYRLAYGTSRPSVGQRLRLWTTHPGFHCVAIYRFGCYARELEGRRRIAGRLARGASAVLNHAMTFLHKVHIGAEVGPGFYIGHVGNIYIGARSIGRNFSVTHNVTIGRGQHEGERGGIPKLGDDVWIGTGSILSGPIEIGTGATIAAGTVLTRSVPEGALAAGNPGRVANAQYDNRPLFGDRANGAPARNALRPDPS